MNQDMGVRGGAGRGETTWVSYLNTIVKNSAKSGMMTRERELELRSLAEALDKLRLGRAMGSADLLTQRFKALELSVSGRGELADAIQLVDPATTGLMSQREVIQAQKVKALKDKLAKVRGSG